MAKLLPFAIFLLLTSLSSGFVVSDELNLVPRPKTLNALDGDVEITASSRILFATRDAPRQIESSLRPLAEVLAREIEMVAGFLPAVEELDQNVPRSGDIVLGFVQPESFAETEAEEVQSYELVTMDGLVTIRSCYYKGVAYGTSTFIQAITPFDGGASMPVLQIRDEPDFAYRTLMIDIARRPHSLEALREVIRIARLYKIRYLQLHLTDNQNFVFPFEPVTGNLDDNYTFSREQWLELVSYADARGVTIIPELDLPGHSGKLRQSGYLNEPGATDFDVAGPENYDKINAIVDDMLSVFQSSPYFHIGGDESGAGQRLVPFLEQINRHLRSKPIALRRRLLVWEGFHGAPLEALPATGPDRIIVLAWESSYNAPWDLLENGYTIINASWKPLYVVGTGTPKHPGTGIRAWSPETIYSWDATTFMHWEPGRPVFEDAGPNDDDRNDSQWNVSSIGRVDQVLGGQLLFWEQEEQWLIHDLEQRLPAFSERLWNMNSGDFDVHRQRVAKVNDRVMALVRPVAILPDTISSGTEPMDLFYRTYESEELVVTMENRTAIDGIFRYETAPYSGNLNWIHSGQVPPVTAESPVFDGPARFNEPVGIRARLFRHNGEPVEGTSWEVFNNWPSRVLVTEYSTVPDQYPLNNVTVPDTTRLDPDSRIAEFVMPCLRGPVNHINRVIQRHEATLLIEAGGRYQFRAQSQSGRATIYMDLNRNGQWDPGEAVISDTPTSEEQLETELELTAGEYALRVDHITDMPRPVIIVSLSGPDTGDQYQEISSHLKVLKN
ncbi:MAG: family 20 glycosylhydrolase [Planctomycetota bacterium]